MKIIHTSDLHLGSPLTAHLDGARIKQRQRELNEGFARLAKEARDIGAAAIIIAGDLFDSECIKEKELNAVDEVLTEYSEIAFFYLAGNHEREAFANRVIKKSNLFIFGKDWTYFEAGDLTVVGRSECESGMGGMLKLDNDRINIAVLHGKLRGGDSGKDSVGSDDVSGRGINYLALGHYHKYSEHPIDRRGIAVYSGTPEGRGFDEVGERGYVLLEIRGGRLSHRFIPFAKRQMRIVDIDVSGVGRVTEIAALCDQALRNISPEDLVRIRLCGRKSGEVAIDTVGLKRKFENRFFYLDLTDDTSLYIDPAEYLHDPSLKGEFIRLVMSDKQLSDSLRAKVIGCGLHALRGEEFFDV